MAKRVIPPDPLTPNKRKRETACFRDLVSENYGAVRTHGPCPHSTPANAIICTGGSSMTALLGPDLGDGVIRGSKTNTTSLQPLMGLLSRISGKVWIAGHLLNADFGGSGTSDNNLTPLTSAANSAHKTFEGHIKNMLVKCELLDRNDADAPEWYGVSYSVTVSPLKFANLPSPADMHDYVYSHISVSYSFVKLPKFPLGSQAHLAPLPPNISIPVAANDPKLADLKNVPVPSFNLSSVNIANFVAAPNGISYSMEIHNEP
jgi:hypothetical protein